MTRSRKTHVILFAWLACLILTAWAPRAYGITPSTATRVLPAQYTPSLPVPVQIVVRPFVDITTWTLTETLPTSWTASAINLGGVWDAVNHRISWGPFDETSHTLTYLATPPLGTTGLQTFSGTAAFDLINQAVGGQSTIALDTIAPMAVSITRRDANPTSVSMVHYLVAFTEPVTGLDTSDFTLARTGTLGGATVTGVSDGPTTWTVTANTNVGNGTLRLDLNSDGNTGIKDLAGNNLFGGYSNGDLYTYDRIRPQVTMSTTYSLATTQAPIPVKVAFSEPVHGFDASDIITTHAQVTDFVTSTSAIYTFNLVPAGQGPLAAGIGAGAARDGAGNGNPAATRLSMTYDTVAPGFSSITATPPQARMLAPVTIAFTASEALGDSPVVAVNGHPAQIQGINGLTYAYAYTIGASDPDGPARIDIAGSDPAGNATATSSTTALLVDKTPPSGSVMVNAGAPYTTSTAVALRLLANDGGGSGVTQVSLSNDGNTWSNWGAYATPLSWTLNPGDGLQAVYAMFKDGAGNVSDVTSDTIVLDTVAPVFSNFSASPALATLTAVVTTTFTASEALLSSPTLLINNHPATIKRHSGLTYGYAYAITASDPDGPATVTASARDRAGNPGATTTTAVLFVDKTTPTGSVVINSGAAYATSTTAYLTIAASDGTGSGVAQMSLSNDGLTWSPWEDFGLFRVWTLSGGDGVKTVWIKFQDRAGHISAGVKDTILLDTAKPQSQVTAPSGSTISPLLTLNWTATDPAPTGMTASGIKQVEILWSKDGGPWTSLGTYGPGVSSTTFDANAHGGNGAYLFFSVATDQAGFVESWPATADVIVSVAQPASPVIRYLLGISTSATGLDYNGDGKVSIADELYRLAHPGKPAAAVTPDSQKP